MATFTYIARDANGQQVSGKLAGATERAVLAELHSRDLAPVRVREVRERFGRRRVSSRKLATAYRQLADLLRAGVPLMRALRLLSRGKSNPNVARVMGELAEAIADGERLADAMAVRQDMFPSVHVAMVRAGEQGAFLEQVLARLGDFLEHQADMRSKVIGNLIYPVLLLSLALVVVVGALVFLVPRFEPLFARIELPWATSVLLGASRLLTQHWLVILLVVAAAVAMLRWLLRREDVRRWLAERQLRLPKVGPFVSSLATARFTRILGTMLENGIPMIGAMQISQGAAGHPVLADAIEEATDAVRAGESLADPLAKSGMFADEVVEMIRVGESANNLPHVLVSVAESIEKHVDRMLAVLIRLMEPALLLALACVVIFLFLALVLPMMRMSTALSG